ncbi:flagellar biosynthesis protein FliR [Fictibacillus macauensis ZFHKF-1]|uniref:Flagellar biosynthetic protein FliR n=1 Tax=Fictibacillus macauensis ZFHKF-1 TaxID=1196324 RepID=I8AHB9_9BACL|nr:flagellar biosynthetic protein FliR [Fictibacillus macauensis]EIT85097.1 flagellar biosynthesis protein FliR [Fictibacillus macauensis ZFHKF-1]
MIETLPAILLVFIRISVFLATAPVFSYRTIPVTFRLGGAGFLAVIVVMTMGAPHIPLSLHFIVALLLEGLIGMLLGLLASFLLYGVHIIGGFLDLQMGFAIAGVIDPQTGIQTPLMGKYLYHFAMLLLFITNGHYMLLDGIFYSYQFVPIGGHVDLSAGEVANYAVTVFTAMFLIAFQLAMPIVGTLFLVDLALGIVARTVPQINVFVIGLPLKILVAFVILLLVLPLFFSGIHMLSRETASVMRHLLQLLQENLHEVTT